jgi:hypothetical protein
MNTKAFNLEKIREALKGGKEGCPWQRLVDLGYREWQKPENCKWSYEEMVEQAGETYGEVVKLLILLGACHHQVCNGGWIQYFDNGYASKAGRCRDSDDITLHREMLALLTKYGIHQTRTGAAVYPILREFRVVIGDTEEEEDDGGCGCQEVINGDELDALDDRYYKICDPWAKDLKVLAARWLKTGTNPIAAVSPAPPVTTPAPRPRVKLAGRDGNAFAIMGTVSAALRNAGASEQTIRQYRQESMSGDYSHLLVTAMNYCEVG